MYKHFIPAEPKRDRYGNVILDEDDDNQTMSEGKYKDKTFLYIFTNDKNYCSWVLKQKPYGDLVKFYDYLLLKTTSFSIGKYRGQTFEEIYARVSSNWKIKNYVKWVIELGDKATGEMKAFRLYALKQRKIELEHLKQQRQFQEEQMREKRQRNEEMHQLRLKEEEERYRRQKELEQKQREARQRLNAQRREQEQKRQQERLAEAQAYNERLRPLQQQMDTFMSTNPPVFTKDDPQAMAVRKLMYIDGEQIAQISTLKNTPARQWIKQREMYTFLKPLFESKEQNPKPLTLRTPGESFKCCQRGIKLRWKFPEIALYCKVNIRLWKYTAEKTLQTTMLDVGSEDQIEFLVWQNTTYVLVRRDKWLRSAAASIISQKLKKRVASPSEERDALMEPQIRAVTKIWEYYKDGTFGDQYVDDFSRATTQLLMGGSSDIINQCVQSTMDKYWLLYVHKHRTPKEKEDQILRKIVFRKNRLAFIDFIQEIALEKEMQTEVLFIESPQSYVECEPAESSLAFIGFGGKESDNAGPFKTNPVIIMQLALEIFDDGRRACGFFIRPTYEEVREARVANAENGGPMFFELDAEYGGVVPWSVALNIIQSNWDSPLKHIRGKLKPSISASDPNWEKYMKGCGLVFKTSQPEKTFSKSKFETKVLNILELIHKNNGKRGVFELLRTTINSKILEDAEKRAEKQKRK